MTQHTIRKHTLNGVDTYIIPKKIKPAPVSDPLVTLLKEWQKLQQWVKAKQLRLIIILEGGDKKLQVGLKNRLYHNALFEVFRWEEADRENHANWHLQTVAAQLPGDGEIVIYNNAWYASLVDRTEKNDKAIKDFMASNLHFEQTLKQSGFHILKIVLNEMEETSFMPSVHLKPSPKLQQEYLKDWPIISGSNRKEIYISTLEFLLAALPYQDLSFAHELVNHKILKKRAYNLRWATVDDGVIPLTAADPDFPVAKEIQVAIDNYVEQRIFSYGPPEGLPAFKKAAADALQKRKKIRTSADLILPVDGAASGMFTIARFALQPGDEAIIFDPVDFLFQQSIEAAGGKVVRLPFDEKSRTFDPELLESLITKKTKMIAVCNPHNPLGRVLTRAELETIGTLALRHNLWIMNDEIWSDIIYKPNQFVSMASLHPEIAAKTISVHGFSKTFGLAGLRVGYIVAPNQGVFEGILAASKVNTTAAGVSTLSQVAATAAYQKSWYWADAFLEHLTKVRNYAVKRLNEIPGVYCNSPEGTYVLFINISAFGMTAEEMAAYLLREAKVAVVPGAAKWFGPGAKRHIRICFSTSLELIKEALDRIERALNLLE